MSLPQITERLRDPRGIRRGGGAASGPRNFAPHQRGFVRPVRLYFYDIVKRINVLFVV